MTEALFGRRITCAVCGRELDGDVVRHTDGWAHDGCIIPWLREVEPDRWSISDKD